VAEANLRRATALLGLFALLWVPAGLSGLSAPPGWTALPVALFVFIGALGWGIVGLRLLRAWSVLDRERWIWAPVLGLGVVGALQSILAGIDRFGAGPTVVVVLAGIAAALAHLPALLVDTRERPRALGAGWLVGLAPAAALVFVRTAAPPTFYDALVYHLGLPTQFVARGGSVVTPHDHYTAMPLLAEMAASPALLLGGPEAFGALYACEWLLLVGAVVVFVRRAHPTGPVGSAGAAAFVCASMPLVVFLPSGTKPDLLAALWALIAVRALFELWRTDGPVRPALLSVGAAAAGFGCATKTTFLLWLVPLGVVFAVLAVRARLRVQTMLGSCALVLACGAWPYLRNAWRLGDPFYPFGSGTSAEAPAWLEHTRALLAGDARPVTSLDALLALPGELAFGRDPTCNEALGLVFVAGVPLLLLHRATVVRLAPLFVVAALTLPPWLLTHALPRYDPFVWLALGIAGGLGLAHAEVVGRAGVGATVAAMVLAGVQWTWNFAADDSLLRGAHAFLQQRKSRAEFLAGALELAPAYAFLNENARGGCVFLATGDPRIAYLEVPAVLSEVYARPVLDVVLAEASTAIAAVERMRTFGTTHVLIAAGARARLQRRGWSGGDPALWESLPRALGTPVYEDATAAVFALAPPGAPAGCNATTALEDPSSASRWPAR
jgi:hypothetical protein